jgi:hypothetical protein
MSVEVSFRRVDEEALGCQRCYFRKDETRCARIGDVMVSNSRGTQIL